MGVAYLGKYLKSSSGSRTYYGFLRQSIDGLFWVGGERFGKPGCGTGGICEGGGTGEEDAEFGGNVCCGV